MEQVRLKERPSPMAGVIRTLFSSACPRRVSAAEARCYDMAVGETFNTLRSAVGETLDTLRSENASSAVASPQDGVQPQLVLLFERARPLAGGARYSLARIDRVTIGRGK